MRGQKTDNEPFEHPVIAHISKGLEIQNQSTHSISVWTSRYAGLHIRLWVDSDENIGFNYYCRTTSWFYNGERTDLHDSLSLFFSLLLRKLDLCSIFMVLVQNPATGADDEIYGNYLIPEQIDPGLLSAKTVDFEKLNKLIFSLSIFEQYLWTLYGGCPCANCRKELKYDFDYRWQDIDQDRLDHVKKVIEFDGQLTNYMERTIPTWFYYRSFSTGVTLIDSPEIMPLFTKLALSATTVKGLSGDLLLSNQFQHFLSNFVKKKLYKYFKELGNQQPIWF